MLLFCFFSTASINAMSALDSPENGYETYTYWQNYKGEEKTAVYCKPMYEPSFAIDRQYLGENELVEISDVCTDKDKNIYILDGGQGVIYKIDCNYKLKQKITSITGGKEGEVFFDGAQSLFVNNKGEIMIANTEYQTVLVSDTNGNYLYDITLPDSNIIPEDFSFKPIKVATDSKGYIYVLSQGSFYGALMYAPNKTLVSFFGANTVSKTIGATIKSFVTDLFMTNEKRANSDRMLPYQFVDMAINKKDFVYTVTGVKDSSAVSVESGQVQKYSPGGASVSKNTDFNYADATVTKILNVTKQQDLVGIAVDENDFMYLLDSTYGRVFLYDREDRLLCAFGGGIGKGNTLGTFSFATAIALNGNDVLVADKELNSVTVFSLTEYGNMVLNADNNYISGRYSECKADFEKILELDSNSQLSYQALGKIYVNEENYKLGIKYAKIGYDKETYSIAFKSIRRDFLKKYFTVISVFLLFIVFIIPILISRLKVKRKSGIVNVEMRTMFGVLTHPFYAFDRIKYNNEGSVLIACGIICVFYITTVLKTTAGGFLFADYNPREYNALLTLFQTLGFILLWTVANWAVCTLLGGIGTLKEIFITICYALQPIVIYNIIFVIFSNLFVSNEVGFLAVFRIIALAFSGILIAVGSLKIHDFTFSRFVGTATLSLLGMVIVIFLVFVLVTFAQQLCGFIATLTSEIIYS